ncbi:hypothetical protein ACXYL9_01155 [Qipengyuania sp. CAU 1752]
MSAPLQTGVLGRGPWFWAGMALITMAIITALGITGAVEQKPLLLLMLLVPVSLMVPLFVAASRRAEAGAQGCGKGVAQARYIKRVGLFTGLYLVAIASMTYFTKTAEAQGAVRVVLALLPGFAIVGVLWAVGRLIVEESDEFMRMLVIRQTLVATAVALCGASIWGFLEAADIVPHLDAYWVVVAWFAGLGAGAVANRIQFGTWDAI